MPPHLHPRSRSTSSLFAVTVAASFFVVALPHVLPCPAPRVKRADSQPDGTKRRKRRRSNLAEVGDGMVQFESSAEDFDKLLKGPPKRECPVPKPSGKIGKMMGFEKPAPEKERHHDDRYP